MHLLVLTLILMFSLCASAATNRINLSSKEASDFGTEVKVHDVSDQEYEVTIRVPSKVNEICEIVHIETYLYQNDKFLSHSYLSDWEKLDGLYSSYIRAIKSEDIQTKVAARYNCIGSKVPSVAYVLGNLDELISYYEVNDLFAANYVKLNYLSEFPDDIANTKPIDDEFLKLTATWLQHKENIDATIFKTEKNYIDEDLSQKTFYLDKNIVLVKTFRLTDGKLKPQQTQYFKAGKIYLALFDIDRDGLNDVRQYYLDGNLKYTELTESHPADAPKSIWF